MSTSTEIDRVIKGFYCTLHCFQSFDYIFYIIVRLLELCIFSRKTYHKSIGLCKWDLTLFANALQLDLFCLIHCNEIYDTVRCHYNAVQYRMILHTSPQWLQQNIYQSLNPQNNPYLTLVGELWGVFSEDLWEKKGRVIKAPHCIVAHSQMYVSMELLSAESFSLFSEEHCNSDMRYLTEFNI